MYYGTMFSFLPLIFLPRQGHLIIIHTCMPSTVLLLLYVIHVDLYDYRFSVPHVQLLIIAKIGLLQLENCTYRLTLFSAEKDMCI